MRRAVLWAAAVAWLGTGCGGDPLPGETLGSVAEPVKAPLAQAYCDVVVEGKGTKSMEDDYLPHVVQCENGGADLQALKAQAIAARSVAYYNMATKGSICDSQGCQVYGCGATPNALQLQAVKETSGLYLSYDQLLTYGFYVAGDKDTAPPSCKGTGTSTTEHWITYNEGKTGADVKMTALGYIPPNQAIYGQNRGCMGQWGARCLEKNQGYDYDKILRFYYGADIQITQATGPCVTPVNSLPQGYLDEVNCSVIRGWAYDSDKPAVALDVMIYVDVAPGQAGATPIATVANVYRDDLCAAIGSCEHGFEIPTPTALLDGQSHTVWAIAVDADGAPEKELASSPKVVTCSPGSGGAAGGGGSGAGGAGAGTGGAAGGGASASGGVNSKTSVLRGDDGGCSCRAAGRGSGSKGAALAWLVLAAAFRRRRR